MTEAQALVHTFSRSNPTQASFWRQGILLKKERGIIRTQWKDRFVILFEGSLFYYVKQTDLTPVSIIQLMSCRIEAIPEKKFKRKFVFTIHSSSKDEYTFAAGTEEDMQGWINAISENLTKAPSPLPTKEFKKLKVGKSASVYVTGKIAETITNMGAGGKLVRSYVTDETIIIIDAFKNFLVAKMGAEKADKLEKQIISLGIKVALLYRDKKLKSEDVKASMVPIRLIASKAIDGFEIPFAFSSYEAIEALRAVQKAFEKVLVPVLTDKSIKKMAAIFDMICDEELIDDFFEKKKWRECEVVATTLRELWDAGRF